ncbi:MAG: nuclear transport factor 2 family protein [Gammaproteobacteria bacterium]|nr:MAG: nuclear transport factor 2 family protein [Gammaproteobacteria bacterium]
MCKKLGIGFVAAVLTCAAGIVYAGYGDDRALIEDLQARYLFAFDFGDAEGYAGTFTEDGILDYGGGEVKGRKAIAEFIAAGRKRTEEARANTPEGQRPSIGRHIISNIVVKIEGDKAHGVAYWTHMTSGPDGRGGVDFFGHYEDEMVKVNGEWLFARRRIYNEAIPEWASQYVNPVTTPSPPPKMRAPSAPRSN